MNSCRISRTDRPIFFLFGKSIFVQRVVKVVMMRKGLFTLSDSDSEIFLMFAAYTLIFSDGSLIFFAFTIAIVQCK